MRFLSSVIALFFYLPAAFANNNDFNIVTYGAKSDGVTANTKAIQNAIDAATVNGGRVIVPAGRFVTGVIYLKSNVELHFEKGGTLLATINRIDYGPEKASALVVAQNAENVSISGAGTIDGRGDELLKDIYRMLNAGTLKDKEWQTYNDWHQMRPAEDNRPHLIDFTNCQKVSVKNITIKNGLCWIQDYRNCRDMVFDSIRVESNTFLNNDGIDLVDCKNVKLSHSFFNVADDGVCLKSSDPNGACENIEIYNCRIRSSASAFKLGTASAGGFKNIKVRNIEVYDTYRSAIAIESVDGGKIEGIDIQNVNARNTGNAIFIRLGKRRKTVPAGSVSGIYIANVNVQVPAGKPDAGYHMEGPPSLFQHNVFPSSIAGIPGYPVKNVTLNNINITYEGGASKKVAYYPLDSLANIPESIADYPEFSMFGELPVWGFYVRHAENISMKNVHIKYKRADFRTACVFDDVAGLQLTNLKIDKNQNRPVLLFNKVTNRLLYKLQLPGNTKQAIKTQ